MAPRIVETTDPRNEPETFVDCALNAYRRDGCVHLTFAVDRLMDEPVGSPDLRIRREVRSRLVMSEPAARQLHALLSKALETPRPQVPNGTETPGAQPVPHIIPSVRKALKN